jgi:hypothetical protein
MGCMKTHFLKLGLLALLASGCSGLPLKSAWSQGPQPLDADASRWASISPTAQTDLELSAMNDGNTLTLFLRSQARHVKAQVLGAYGQELRLWFDPQCRKRRINGLSLSFSPPKDKAYPFKAAEEWTYLSASGRHLAILMPGKEAYAAALSGAAAALPLQVQVPKGELAVEIQVPLKAGQGRPWGLDARPGQDLDFMVETTPISAEAAEHELAMENEGLGPRTYGQGSPPPKLPNPNGPPPQLSNNQALQGAGEELLSHIHEIVELNKDPDTAKAPKSKGLHSAPDPIQIELTLSLAQDPAKH